MNSRPRPVFIFGAVMVALTAFIGTAGVTDLVPSVVLAWITVITAVLGAVYTFVTQNSVTPLSDPQDAQGRRLVPESQTPRAARQLPEDPRSPRVLG